MTAVNQDGMALRHVCNGLRGEKVIILVAVRRNGQAFESASLGLQGDCYVVLEAVEHNSPSLQHANLTRLAKYNKKCPAKFYKLLSCCTSMTSIYTLIREKPNFVQYGLLQ